MSKEHDGEYKPLKIPADWELARKHGLARSVGKPLETDERISQSTFLEESCPCCGYEVYR